MPPERKFRSIPEDQSQDSDGEVFLKTLKLIDNDRRAQKKETAVEELPNKTEREQRLAITRAENALEKMAVDDMLEKTRDRLKLDRQAIYMEQALRDVTHPPEFVLNYDKIINASTKQLRELETLYGQLPENEKDLLAALKKTPFEDKLAYPQKARDQWKKLSHEMPTHLKRARDRKHRADIVEVGLARYKGMLERAYEFLRDVNEERLNLLARDPQFQQDFTEALN